MPSTDKPTVLVAHPWMARGGSEAAAMWTLEALQHDYDVTFATVSVDDWDDLNRAYGSSVDPDRIETVLCPRLPLADSPAKFALLQRRHFERYCRRLAPGFDLCLSAYNPIDFGRPGIQLIGDFSFSEKMRRKLYVNSERRFHHRGNLVRKLYLALARWTGVPQRPLSARGDLVVANSKWSRDVLAREFDVPSAPILYPPVGLPSAGEFRDLEKRPLSFVALGRISPEKEIEKIVEILRRVREEHGHEVTLSLVGHFDGTAYCGEIRQLVARHSDWVTAHGFLAAEEKRRLLAAHEFAIHGCRIEAFGIAVAEMASLGCLPVVPEGGGAREIAPFEKLHYQSVTEACGKIVTLLQDPALAGRLREQLAGDMQRFGPNRFASRLAELVSGFPGMEGGKEPGHHVEENRPAFV